MELSTWDEHPAYHSPSGGRWTSDKGLPASDDSAVDVRSDGRLEMAEVERQQSERTDSFEPEGLPAYRPPL